MVAKSYLNQGLFSSGVKHTACLLVHGFSGGAAEMRFLHNSLNHDGYPIYSLQLSGHATRPEDLIPVTIDNWQNDVRVAYTQLQQKYSQVVVIGFSLGSLLSIRLADQEKSLRGLVIISPALLKPKLAIKYYHFLLPVWSRLQPTFKIIGGTDPSQFQPPYKSQAYPYIPTISLKPLFQAVNWVRDHNFSFSYPVLIMHGKNDLLVPKSSVGELASHIQTKTIIKTYSNSAHLVPLDKDRQQVAQDILDYIQTLTQL